MQFNELEYKTKLETMLAEYGMDNGVKFKEILKFKEELEVYTFDLLGPSSITVIPYLHRPDYICKLTIYISPSNEKWGCIYDFKYEIKVLDKS